MLNICFIVEKDNHAELRERWRGSEWACLSCIFITFLGSCALSGKMLFVRIVENNEKNTYFRAG